MKKHPNQGKKFENFTSRDWENYMNSVSPEEWDELMKVPQNKESFELSKLNKHGLNLKRPDYWAKNPVNPEDLKRLIDNEKVEETHLPIMIAAFKNFSRTAPKNKRGNIIGYHRTNGILNNAYKYFKEHPNNPMFSSYEL